MRRSTRRSTMAVSIHSSLDFDSNRISTRRSSSILPQSDETRNPAGNFTTKFSMSSFVKKVEQLTHDQRTAIEKVGFGNLLRVPHHTLRKNLLVEWMERWDSEKRAFVLHDKELTITDMDAALILGLRTVGNPVSLSEEDPLSEMEREYGATIINRKISMSAIEGRLQSLGDDASEDFVRNFLLFMFGMILFPSSNAKLDSRYLSFLKDLEGVSKYAWGRAVVEDLFNWLSRRKEEQIKSIEGCLILLQIWSYEHIDIGRPILISCSVDFPRACRWESSRCNSPRHWFTSKFNEVEENQVILKLQPTATEMNNDYIRELLTEEAAGGEKILSTRTNITTSKTKEVPSKCLSQKTLLNEKPEGGVARGKHDQRADFPECSGISEITSEECEREEVLSTRTRATTSAPIGLPPKHDQRADIPENSGISGISSEGFEREEVMSTRTRATTSSAVGLPPKSLSRHAILDKKPDEGTERSKHDNQDLPQDSRQSMDVSVMTEDYAECSSSYGLQEDQSAETSLNVNVITEEYVLENEKLKRENAVMRKILEDLRKENAELKEDNQRLRAPPALADNIERLIDEYFDGV
ncbi:protein MAINTENANCE OF MERISTEMS-like [Chenopodium quinoa]|uniref:protein MAINTENANCE OF MERISTEMS-like n=1 Tax=Chenopodium quinoa TaxID=63459 RepID=UPI000B78DF5F|nr:protein MAINTENANCE OF MERISTEMS-like [Chenopodium quinoa]